MSKMQDPFVSHTPSDGRSAAISEMMERENRATYDCMIIFGYILFFTVPNT